MTPEQNDDNEIRTVVQKNSSSVESSPPKDGSVPTGKKLLLFKVGSALFYGIASFTLTVCNKAVLTYYAFPSFLMISVGQMLATVLVLFTCRSVKLVSFPSLNRVTFRLIWPLPLLFLGNMVFGLGSTQALSLPMFTALRKFSILLTMILELVILKIRPVIAIQLCVYGMVAGDLIAAFSDLSFNATGYTYVMMANAVGAMNIVFLKQKLNTLDLGKFGLMFYNSLLMFLPALMITWVIGDLHKGFVEFKQWDDPLFILQFCLSLFMGCVLMYSQMLCTQYNSPLTTTVVGCLKNVSITYFGMIFGNDYKFSWVNFVGINISVGASLLYTYVTFSGRGERKIKDSQKTEKSETRKRSDCDP